MNPNPHRNAERVPWQQFAHSAGEVLRLAPLPLPCLYSEVRKGHDPAWIPSLDLRPHPLHSLRLQTRMTIPRILTLLPYVVW